MLFFRCIVFWGKSLEIYNRSPNSTQENLKPIQSRGNVYNPSNSPPQACYFQSVKPKLRKVPACSINHFASKLLKSLHIWFLFTWSLLYLISDWFSDTIFKNVSYSPFVAFLIEAAAAHRLLILFQLSPCILGSSWRFKSPGPNFTNRFINSLIIFNLYKGLKIGIIGPRSRTAFSWATVRHIYFA